MRKDYKVYVKQAIDAVGLIDLAMEGLTPEDLAHDPVTASAIMYQLIILGEIAGRLPNELLESHTNVPWHEVKGMRNRLVHDYNDVKISVLIEIVKNDLPILRQTLEVMLESAIEVAA
jgi:uncharacterized protein with HEPN domain